MILTKTRSNSRNWSRDGIQLRFDNHRLPQDTISGTQGIGAPSIDGSRVGNVEGSLQTAIEDLAGISVAKVNQILIFEEGTDPNGVSMIERLVVDGSDSGQPLYVYGFHIELTVGDNRATITQKIFDTLQTVQADSGFFKSIRKVSGTDNELDIEFADCRNHDLTSIVMPMLTIHGSVLQEAVPGYGVWTIVGSQSVVADGITTKMNYFKRTS